MKVQIRDRDALLSLPLRNLRSYLKYRSWKDEGQWGKRPASFYTFERGSQRWSVVVPYKDTSPGYAERMAEAVTALAEVEERSQLDVFYDISEACYDVVRMHPSKTVNASEAPLSLNQGAGLLKDARSMFAAAARAVEKPQSIYRGPFSSQVSDYLSLVRPLRSFGMGQSLTLYSPLFLQQPTLHEGRGDALAPFPRRAIRKLSEALEHTDKAIEESLKKDSLEPFQDAVPYGVSANLCDSLAALTAQWNGIVIHVSWSEERLSNVEPRRFQFTIHSAEMLAEAAAQFRSTEPFLDETVVAWVVKLEREPEEFDGRAGIYCVRNGKPLRMNVVFEAPSFKAVIRAFDERRPISLDGDIYRAGNGYELRRPRNLSLIMHE
ncbi:MAG: hypothetical protein OXT69_07395 [Candidatus Poribacteria bacterium]|nr:hypothetical protein [Candidatus Poribacteria bacterium]